MNETTPMMSFASGWATATAIGVACSSGNLQTAWPPMAAFSPAAITLTRGGALEAREEVVEWANAAGESFWSFEDSLPEEEAP